MIEQWQRRLAEGHTETWLATVIIVWAFFVVLVAIWLAQQKSEAVKWILAGILLYEILP